jgi:hypothetical protein
MDQAVLVERDVDIAGRVLEALSRTRMPVSFADWYYVPQLEEWQLVIATPWCDTKGPITAWSAFVNALESAGIHEEVPTRRVFLKSPNDPLVKSLEDEAREGMHGFLHIAHHPTPDGQREYSVIFAPVSGRGGPVPSMQFSNRQDLEKFLASRLQLRKTAVSDALFEVDKQGYASIFPVQLSFRELKKSGLA